MSVHEVLEVLLDHALSSRLNWLDDPLNAIHLAAFEGAAARCECVIEHMKKNWEQYWYIQLYSLEIKRHC
jgi:hypothetical protein